MFPHDLDLHGTTDLDVATAIANDTAFPDRPNGTIELGHIGFTTQTGAPVTFDAAGTPVEATFSAGVAASAGVFPTMKAALDSLNLGETPGLTLAAPDPVDDSRRYVLLTTNYSAKGTVNGKHPLGAVGSLSVGASAASGGTLAVLHRVEKNGPDGRARTALTEALTGWRLPRDVRDAAALAPNTWLIAEVDGSIALSVSASLGYNVDFVRTLKTGDLSGDVGVKIDAAVKATFGLDVSGRYVAIVGRESDDQRVRVRLFKLRRNGVSFGIDLKVGVTGVETVTPDKLDDLVASVFGVHGTQIVAALARVDEWTAPGTDIGSLVAGLTDTEAQKLFQALTGVPPKDSFESAVAPVRNAVRQWKSLPATVSSELWNVLRDLGLDAAGTDRLKASLDLLTTDDSDEQKRAFRTLLETDHFSASPVGRLLSAAADRGLLGLVQEPGALKQVAQTISDILSGGIIAKLQKYVLDELNLQKIVDAADDPASFQALNSWLVARLAAFFDKQLAFVGDLKDVQAAIKAVRDRSAAIYGEARKALNSRYGLDMSATWERTTADTAVFDVEFTTSADGGRTALAALLADANFDAVLTSADPAVKIRTGVLTHEVTRKSIVNLTLPHVDLRSETLNDALARVVYDASGAGVLGYQATGRDVDDARRRYRSALSVSVAASVPAASASDVRIHSVDGTWSYQLLNATAGMQREEFEATTEPFLDLYMHDKFTTGVTVQNWCRQVDDSIEAKLHNGADVFGDVCAAYEVSVPAAALGPWFVRAADAHAAANRLSIAIQAKLKEIVAFYYLCDVKRLVTIGSSFPLLTWASIPPANSIAGNDDVIWDARESAQLDRMTDLAVVHVTARLEALRHRLAEAHLDHSVPFYAADQGRTIVDAAKAGASRLLLDHLLAFERAIVERAASAYAEAQQFLSSDKPSDALIRLADFAGDITAAFNSLAGKAVFVDAAFRPLAQSVFAAAASALDPTIAVRPSAMLTISVMNPARTFDIATFPDGKTPPLDQVAIGQRLVSL